jgi:hypothetical protein
MKKNVLKLNASLTQEELMEIKRILAARMGVVKNGVVFGGAPALRDPGPVVYGRVTFHPEKPLAAKGGNARVEIYRNTIWV